MSYPLQHIRSQFPSLWRVESGKAFAYFDGPGGTQVPESVMEAISHYYRTHNANAHGPFVTSHETDVVIHRARSLYSAWVGSMDPNTISFGPNMTTLNFALSRALRRDIQPGDEVIVTDLDHEANIAPWVSLSEAGAVIRHVGIRPDGTLDMEAMRAAITPKTKIVAVGLASNAIGTLTDAAEVSRMAHEVGAYVVMDAVHYAPHYTLDVKALDPDFLLCSVYKFYGPHIGVLYSRPGLLDGLKTDRLPPAPGSAPGKIETGTMNFAALAGSTAALEFIAGVSQGALPSYDDLQAWRQRFVDSLGLIGKHEHELSRYLYDGLKGISGLTIHGLGVEEGARRTPTVAFTLEGMPSIEVAKALAQEMIFVWAGHFYAPVLIERLGTQGSGGVVRVGISMYNTKEEIDRLLTVVRGLSA